MLFRRRKPIGALEKVRIFFWPRRSFSRSFQYFGKRILRLTATPHAIAAGVAAGVMASWTPFLGFHFIIAAALAYVFAGNIIASALGTAFGNPLTFPFIWTATFKVGKQLTVDDFHGEVPHIHLGRLFHDLDLNQLWEPVLKPMLFGCVPFMLTFGLLAYVLTYFGVVAFQNQRRRKLLKRRGGGDLSGEQTV
ncbi:DUF2062 domain-containing protein [Hoeflea prorocentri]|uniref:DUF2062 domain-containing protein n=1 Tax=Hoeflea prorocentri TaxID=1922333 RepID=A0A9X3UIJ4_9HYPH|nr:DUF2062 domain-containing protein [Hoeflea prorocentri]MCY6381460.1 DUF2062 domain-containing protein [Hoeflea prorocentri]MDA5399260.1 DUF2062 domain-containing protein [Hoeflea prorocentri]